MRILHRWIAAVIGIQLLAWTTGGFVFAWNPIEEVRGETSVAKSDLPDLPPPEDVVSLPAARAAYAGSTAAAASGAGFISAQLAWLRDRWVWRLRARDDPSGVLVDARHGVVLPPLDADQARQAAAARFIAPGRPVGTEFVTHAEGEYRGKPVPAWKVAFDDTQDTNVYLDAMTGEITAVRSDVWRRFDFFWMLHIMDYGERDNFHHLLLKIAALFGITTSITGIWLAVLVLPPHRG